MEGAMRILVSLLILASVIEAQKNGKWKGKWKKKNKKVEDHLF